MEIPFSIQASVFLKEFKKIVSQSGNFYVVNRKKNRDALIELGLTRKNRKDEILSLSTTDYCSGPKPDKDMPGEIWEFGRMIDGNDVYIKLKIAQVGNDKIAKCISFHKAEFPLSYPLK